MSDSPVKKLRDEIASWTFPLREVVCREVTEEELRAHPQWAQLDDKPDGFVTDWSITFKGVEKL